MITNFDIALKQILWIGGGADAGKTTAAQILSEKHGLKIYHFDQSSGPAKNIEREQAPRMHEWLEMSIDERWQLRSPEEIAQHTFDTFAETFAVRLEEIVKMSGESIVIAEGFGFIPALIEPLISNVHQAIWMIPTEEFKKESFKRREKDLYAYRDGSSNPELAIHNFFIRDILMALRMREDAESRGLRVLEIDGSLPPNEVALTVESHFAKYLDMSSSGVW